MQAENRENDFPQNDRETRKPWQSPAVEVLMVDKTENDFTGDFEESGLGS
jgi:hypothetical protein